LGQKENGSTKLLSGAKWQSVKRFVATVMRFELGTACVDLDSVLLYHDHKDGISHLGRPLPLGRELTKLLKSKGYRVVVLTARSGRYEHGMIHERLRARGFEVDRVTNRKPAADAYFDDKACRIPKNWK
jgi:hypothetical protein